MDIEKKKTVLHFFKKRLPELLLESLPFPVFTGIGITAIIGEIKRHKII